MIRKLRLISKFITSQTGQQIITTHILSIISRYKDNQAINLFREGSTRPLMFFKKSLYKIKISVHLYFGEPGLGPRIKTNL